MRITNPIFPPSGPAQRLFQEPPKSKYVAAMTSPLRILPLIPFFTASILADTFGSGANQFDIDFVDIGDAGNANDIHGDGYGGVGYAYRIGKHEVSRAMINSYNALSGGPLLTMANMTSYSGNGVNKPATGVSWNEAARFVNWLNTSQGYSAAYRFITAGANDNIVFWTAGDAGYDPSNPFRNSNAHYFLPSEDEWYKAAYYDPRANGGTGGYWNYATGSDTAPTPVTSGTTSVTAVYGQSFATGPADINNAGGLSRYGTMAQNGNLYEWAEGVFLEPIGSAADSRVWRGGAWSSNSFNISTSDRSGISPTTQSIIIGFRVASVPEPSSPPALKNFTYDASTGECEVSIEGSANTAYKLVEADDLDFTTSDPVTLTGVIVGSLSGNEMTTDENGNATVQFNLGTTKDASFIRAETP